MSLLVPKFSSGKASLDVLTEVNVKGQSIIMVTHDLKSARRVIGYYICGMVSSMVNASLVGI